MDFNITTIVVVVVVFFIVLYVLKLLFRALGVGKQDMGSSSQVYKQCASCGWKGQVSKFHRKCPNCGTELI